MAEVTRTRGLVDRRTGAGLRTADRSFQAYRILHVAFIAAPTIAGIDKFFHLLVNWDQYLAPRIEQLLPMSGHSFMLIVGAIELAAGLLVAIKPRIGAYVVAAWLGGIILNLLIHGRFFDIALRDLGLMLGALALGRLSHEYERGRRPVTAPVP